MSDWLLLRRYVENGSEEAFASLVERHKRLVYWTCRRDIADVQLAEDAAQAVFVILARKAASVRKDASLAGWLFSVARNVSRRAKMAERRRWQKEQAAAMSMHSQIDPNAAWEQAEPWINDALSALPDADRSAILLRYCEEYSFPEIAVALGTTEEAARKRVVRSLERVRSNLAKRNVSIASALLAALLAERAAQAVPESCTAMSGKAILAIASSGPAHVATVHNSALLAKKGAYILMDATMKKTLIVAGCCLLAGSFVFTEYRGHVQSQHGALPGAAFADNAPDPGPNAAQARREIDGDYTDMLNKVQQGGQYTLNFLPGSQTQQVIWPSNQHTVSFTLRQFAVAGTTATSSVDTQFNIVGDGSHMPSGTTLDITASERDHWTNVAGRWVLSQRESVVKPHGTWNGGPIPAGATLYWDGQKVT